MGKSAEQTPDAETAVTPAELRTPDLPLQPFGGYSRAETTRLLARAAKTLEATESGLQPTSLPRSRRRSSRRSARSSSLISSLKAVLGVAHPRLSDHQAAEVVRAEAKEEAHGLVAAARAQAQEIVQEAERRTEELRAANAQIEDAIARARDEAQLAREDAERDIAELRDEARRVRSVIDDFRTQWGNLIQDALRQLELGFPGGSESGDGSESLERELRERLAEPRAEDEAVEPSRTQGSSSADG
jgi:hypothetical protein